MDANEARVREVWEKVDESVQRCNLTSPREWHGYVFALVDGRERTLGSGNRAERWSAAAAYTEQVIEEARQLRREIEVVGRISRWYGDEAIQSMHMGLPGSASGEVRDECTANRAIARLEAIYAAHTRGIKPEALERMGQ